MATTPAANGDEEAVDSAAREVLVVRAALVDPGASVGAEVPEAAAEGSADLVRRMERQNEAD